MPYQHASGLVRAITLVATLLLSALLMARGSSKLVAARLLPTPLESSTRRTLTSASAAEPAVEIAQAVLERNIFDSARGAMAWNEEEPAQSGRLAIDGVEPRGAELVACGGNLRLVATTVVPRRPELSIASFSTGVEGKALLYRQGMMVQGQEVVGIRAQRVFLRAPGRNLCHASMFTSSRGTPGASVREEQAPSSAQALSEAELDAGIRRIDDTHYTLARQLVDKLLSAPSELMRIARAVPYEENGRTLGIKLYGIRRAALLGKLGFQNGDLLRSVNGFDFSSPDSLLEAYTKLRALDQLSVVLTRRGERRTLEVQVQ